MQMLKSIPYKNNDIRIVCVIDVIVHVVFCLVLFLGKVGNI